MRPTLATGGVWRAALSEWNASGAFQPEARLRGRGRPSDISGKPIAITAELVRHPAGIMPRALLAGHFEPNPDSSDLIISVGYVPDLPIGAPKACRSLIFGTLVAGLATEFAQPTLAGLIGGLDLFPLPAGLLTIDSAGYDQLESGSMAFQLTARLLVWGMHVLQERDLIGEADLARVVAGW